MFAPSRRGGNNKKRARTDSEDISKEDDDPPRSLARSTAEVTSGEENPAQTFPYPQPPPQPRHLSVHNLLGHSPPPARYLQQFGHTSSSTHSSPQTSFSAEHATPQTRPTLPSIQSHTATGYADSPPSPRRKRMANPPLHAADPSSIVVADMRNESDALQILALASGQAANREGEEERSDRYDGQSAAGTVDSTGMGGHQQQMRGIPSSPEKEIQLAKLAQFPLVKMGILSVEQTRRLVDMFFKCHHHFFVSFPTFFRRQYIYIYIREKLTLGSSQLFRRTASQGLLNNYPCLHKMKSTFWQPSSSFRAGWKTRQRCERSMSAHGQSCVDGSPRSNVSVNRLP